ncbi:MAG: hypothetical protein GY755_03115 [Chloroflexi bacterium]|nr:hypothetical protein [Chloroflexota bacterium]
MIRSKIIFLLSFIFLLTSCEPATAVPTTQPTLVPSPTSSPFSFGPHSADEAQRLLAQAEKAIHVGNYADFSSDYYLAAEYAAWGALQRFPDDPRAENWKWKFAYYATLNGDTEMANDSYMKIISNALNKGEVVVDDLEYWFESGELDSELNLTPRFSFALEEVDANQKSENYVIHIRYFTSQGSCYLLSKTKDKYSISLVHSGFLEGGLAFSRYDSTNCDLKDLTGDGFDEIIVERYYGGHVGYSTTQVFDISSLSLVPLPFIDLDGEEKYVIYESVNEYLYQNGKNLILLSDFLYNCLIWVHKTFEWDGDSFVIVDIGQKVDWEHVELDRCGSRLRIAAHRSGVDDGVAFLDEAVQIYSAHTLSDQEKQYVDRLQIEKALLYLFANEPEKTRVALEEFLEHPYQGNSIWVEPVKDFLDIYQGDDDIYRACSVLVPCDSYAAQDQPDLACFAYSPCARDALQYLVEERFTGEPIDRLEENLINSGVEMAHSEYIDFNRDGQNEFLFSVAEQGKDTYRVWVAVQYDGITRVYDIATPLSAIAQFDIVKIEPDMIFVNFDVGGGLYWTKTESGEMSDPKVTFSAPVDVEHLKEFAKRFEREVDSKKVSEIRHELLFEKQFEEAYQGYTGLTDEKYNDCFLESKKTYACAYYYYDIGFSAELAGDEEMAREMYSNLIEQYPEHPLAFLAYNKLQ